MVSVILNILCLLAVVFQTTFCADDCAGFTNCLKGHYSNLPYAALDPTSKESLKGFMDVICNKGYFDNIVKCYSPSNMAGCSTLKNIVKYRPSEEETRQQFEKVCSQKEAVLGFAECLMKPKVLQGVQDCSVKMVESIKSSDGDQKSQQEAICSATLALTSCMSKSMEGTCSPGTVSFFKQNTDDQYYMICSAPVLMVNVCLLCILSLIIHFLL